MARGHRRGCRRLSRQQAGACAGAAGTGGARRRAWQRLGLAQEQASRAPQVERSLALESPEAEQAPRALLRQALGGRRGRASRLGNNRSGGAAESREEEAEAATAAGFMRAALAAASFAALSATAFCSAAASASASCAKMLAHFYRGCDLDRTGMRLFLGDAGFGQIVNDGLCLDLELASQFVDSDLIRIGHCPPGRLLFSVLV